MTAPASTGPTPPAGAPAPAQEDTFVNHDRLAPLAAQVGDLARQAGEAILKVYAQDFEVDYKDDASPLTQADLASQRCIVAGLRRLTPDIPILAEESAGVPYEERRRWRHFWLVDPLDGTKEFVKRNGEFTVNIALVEAGRPILGVVHTPVEDVTYLAARGLGARRLEHGANAREVRTHAPDDTLRVVVSRSHAGESTRRLLERLERSYQVESVSRGSALKICLVAEGAAHVYPRLGPTMEWDTAAAQCVVEEAGGSLWALPDGAPLRYNKQELRNPSFLVAHGEPERWLELASDL